MANPFLGNAIVEGLLGYQQGKMNIMDMLRKQKQQEFENQMTERQMAGSENQLAWDKTKYDLEQKAALGDRASTFVTKALATFNDPDAIRAFASNPSYWKSFARVWNWSAEQAGIDAPLDENAPALTPPIIKAADITGAGNFLKTLDPESQRKWREGPYAEYNLPEATATATPTAILNAVIRAQSGDKTAAGQVLRWAQGRISELESKNTTDTPEYEQAVAVGEAMLKVLQTPISGPGQGSATSVTPTSGGLDLNALIPGLATGGLQAGASMVAPFMPPGQGPMLSALSSRMRVAPQPEPPEITETTPAGVGPLPPMPVGGSGLPILNPNTGRPVSPGAPASTYRPRRKIPATTVEQDRQFKETQKVHADLQKQRAIDNGRNDAYLGISRAEERRENIRFRMEQTTGYRSIGQLRDDWAAANKDLAIVAERRKGAKYTDISGKVKYAPWDAATREDIETSYQNTKAMVSALRPIAQSAGLIGKPAPKKSSKINYQAEVMAKTRKDPERRAKVQKARKNGFTWQEIYEGL